MKTKQKTLSKQNQKIVGILTTYRESEDLHTINGLCYFLREPFDNIARINSYTFFDLFVCGYLQDCGGGYCEKRQIMADMIIDLFVNFNPTLKDEPRGEYSLKSRKKGFKEALNMICYYGGYR